MCINAVCTVVSLSCNNHESSKMHCVVCVVSCEACLVCCVVCAWCVVGYGCAWCVVGYGCAWCVVYTRYTQEDSIFERSEHKALLLQIQHKAMRIASVSNICDGILLCPSANKKASRHHQMCLRLVLGSHIHRSDQLFTSYQHHPKLFHTTCKGDTKG